MTYAIMPSDDLMVFGMPYQDEITYYCGATGFVGKKALNGYLKRLVKTIKETITEKYGKDTYENYIKGNHLNILVGDGTWGGMELDHTIEL